MFLPDRTLSHDSSEHIYVTPAQTEGLNVPSGLIVQAETQLNVGPKAKLYTFEYRPNPVIEDIHPQTTIVR